MKKRRKYALLVNSLCTTGWAHYAVDGIALVVLVVASVKAAKRGFVDCLFGFLSTIVALILAFTLTKSVIEWTNGLFGLRETIENAAANALSGVNGFDIDISKTGIETALADKNLPQFMIDLVMKNFDGSTVSEGTTLAIAVGGVIGSLAITLIAWILLFILAKLVIRLLRRLLTTVIEGIPLVGTLNHFLGFVVGILEGLLIISGIVAIVALIPAESVTAFFNECVVVKALFNYNPINVILGWIL